MSPVDRRFGDLGHADALHRDPTDRPARPRHCGPTDQVVEMITRLVKPVLPDAVKNDVPLGQCVRRLVRTYWIAVWLPVSRSRATRSCRSCPLRPVDHRRVVLLGHRRVQLEIAPSTARTWSRAPRSVAERLDDVVHRPRFNDHTGGSRHVAGSPRVRSAQAARESRIAGRRFAVLTREMAVGFI